MIYQKQEFSFIIYRGFSLSFKSFLTKFTSVHPEVHHKHSWRVDIPLNSIWCDRHQLWIVYQCLLAFFLCVSSCANNYNSHNIHTTCAIEYFSYKINNIAHNICSIYTENLKNKSSENRSSCYNTVSICLLSQNKIYSDYIVWCYYTQNKLSSF